MRHKKTHNIQYTDPLKGTAWSEAVPFFAHGDHLLLLDLVAKRRQTEVVYPPQNDLLRAFQLTDFFGVHVVILGQDPYHAAGQAHGLAFSVPHGQAVPRSLANIRKEILHDVYAGVLPPHWLGMGQGIEQGAYWPMHSGNLEHWARQGVLLLNVACSVRAGAAGSHAKLGWHVMTQAVLAALAAREQPIAILLWGKWAAAYAPIFAPGAHLVLTAAHPSPLSASRGFFGCRHFSQVNIWLTAQGLQPILW